MTVLCVGNTFNKAYCILYTTDVRYNDTTWRALNQIISLVRHIMSSTRLK